jgi:hypothetical protein
VTWRREYRRTSWRCSIGGPLRPSVLLGVLERGHPADQAIAAGLLLLWLAEQSPAGRSVLRDAGMLSGIERVKCGLVKAGVIDAV